MISHLRKVHSGKVMLRWVNKRPNPRAYARLKTYACERIAKMADVNRGNRPLSPHLTIYRPQYTSILSILHRITGVGLTLGVVLVVWWLLAAATGAEYFDMVDGLLTSWFGHLVLLGMTWALAYHFLNGMRHLVWDTGRGLELDQAELSGKAVVAGSVALTLLIWAVA